MFNTNEHAFLFLSGYLEFDILTASRIHIPIAFCPNTNVNRTFEQSIQSTDPLQENTSNHETLIGFCFYSLVTGNLIQFVYEILQKKYIT